MIDDLIVRMDSWLQKNRAGYYACLRPGVTDEAMSEFEEEFLLRLPDDFRTLYRWRDGQPANEFASLQGNWMFASLKDVTETKGDVEAC